jgi:hypothetical protein
MAHRLLPFRQYDENDVVNLFALRCDSVQLLTAKPDVDGINADGVLVAREDIAVHENDMGGVIDVSKNDSTFMNSYSSPVGRNPYPVNPLKLKAAISGDACLGITLNQTLAIDENNEQLLYNPVKKDELQAVLSGQTVPVLTKGLVTLHSAALTNTPSVGDYVASSATAGKMQGITKHAGTPSPDQEIVGTVLATGYRGLNHSTANNQGIGAAGADFQSGAYYLIKLDC